VDELVEKSYEYENKGNYQQALTNMFAVTHLAPSDAYYNLRTGWLYYALYNYTDALKYYNISYSIDQNFEALEGIVLANYMIGNWDQTIEYGKKALLVTPTSFLTLAKIGYSYYAKEDWANASLYYSKACEIYSYNISCLGYYLSSLVKNNQIKDSKIIYQKLKKLNPSNEFLKLYENQLQ
jgi:tetratricopeptide (TPR) repeat protein